MSEIGKVSVVIAAKIDQLERDLAKARAELRSLGPAAQEGAGAARSGLDNLTRALSQAGTAANATQRGIESLGQVARQQVESMGAFGRAGVGALDAIGAASTGVLVGLAAVTGGVLLLGKALSDAGKYAQDVHLLSQQAGLGAAEFTKLAYAAKIAADVTGGDLVQSLRIFANKRDEALRGNTEAIEAFKRVNVDFARPAGEAFKQLADHVAGLADKNEKVAIATDFLGRSGARLVPLLAEQAAGIQRLGDEAERFGSVIDERLTGKIDALGDSTDRVGTAVLGVEVSILKLADSSGAIDVLTESFNALAEAVGAVGRGIGSDTFKNLLANAFPNAALAVKAIKSATAPPVLPAGATPNYNQSRAEFDAAQALLGGQSSIVGDASADGSIASIVNSPEAIAAAEADLSRAKQQRIHDEAAARAQAELAREQQQADAEHTRQLTEQLRIEEQTFKLNQDTAQLEASTVAGAAKTRLEQAERGLDLQHLSVAEQEKLYALARQVDAAEAARLQQQIASLEAARDQVDAAHDVNTELESAQIAYFNAQVMAARENFEAMPSAVDTLTDKLSEAADTAKEFVNIGKEFSENIIQGLINSPNNLGDVAKRSFQALGVKMFEGIIEEKGLFDLKVKKNFLEDLPGFAQDGADRISDAFDGLFGGGQSGITTTGAASAAVPSAADFNAVQAAGGQAFSSVNEFSPAVPQGFGADVGGGGAGGDLAGGAGGAAGLSTAAASGIAAGIVLAALGTAQAAQELKHAQTKTEITAATAGFGDPILHYLLNLLGVKDAGTQVALEKGVGGLFSGGVAPAAMAIMNAFGAFAPKSLEGLVGNALGDLLNQAHIPIAYGSGGRRPGGPSQATYQGPNNRDRYFPLVPLPEDYSNLNLGPLSTVTGSFFNDLIQSGIPSQGGVIPGGQVQAILNNFAALGLGQEDTQRQINQLIGGMLGGDFDQAILTLQANRMDAPFGQGPFARLSEDEQMTAFLASVEGAIEAFVDLSPAVDASRLALLALGEDGTLQLEALKRQIASAQSLAEGLNLGQVAQQAFVSGGDPERTLRQNAIGTAQQIIFDQISQSAVGENFQDFTANVAAAAEAYRQGDTEHANELLREARDNYDAAAAGAAAYFDELRAGSPELAAMIDELEAQHDALQRSADAANIGANAFNVLLRGGGVEDVARSTGEQFAQIFGQALSEELLNSELFTATLGPALESARDYARHLAAGDTEAAAADLELFRQRYASGSQAFTDLVANSDIGDIGNILGLGGGGSAGPAPSYRAPGNVRLPTFADGGIMPGPQGVHSLALVAGGERVSTVADQREERAMRQQELNLMREQNAMLRALLNKDFGGGITDADVAQSLDRTARRNSYGSRIVPDTRVAA